MKLEVFEGPLDLLLHLVRNAVDHGLEPSAVRVAAAKPAAGRLSLVARRRGPRVEIEILDGGQPLYPYLFGAE